MGTKDKLFISMYDLIAEVGYEKASINQICNNAGIKKSSFYYFYESKEDLFKELIKSGYNSKDDEKINIILNTSTKEEYKKELLNLGSIIIGEFETDLKWKKVIAEIELQAVRNNQINLLLEDYVKAIKSDFKKILQHGVEIKAFNIEFDIELNINILYVLVQGIDSVLLTGVKLDAIKIFEKIINGMF